MLADSVGELKAINALCAIREVETSSNEKSGNHKAISI